MEDSDHEDIGRDFIRLSKLAQNNGYREGISDGKESYFQESFDAGYSQGLKMAMTLGFYEGLLSSTNKDISSLSKDSSVVVEKKENDLMLKSGSKAHCQICSDPKLLETSQEEVENSQCMLNETITKSLKTKYSCVLNEVGIMSRDLT